MESRIRLHGPELAARLFDCEQVRGWIDSDPGASVPLVGAAQLIALKARAWIDLTEREALGEKIDSKTIKKHKNDVFRLYQILDPTSDPAAPEVVKSDVREFNSRMHAEIDLKALGVGAARLKDILQEMARVFRL
jgi:hypothetical protein